MFKKECGGTPLSPSLPPSSVAHPGDTHPLIPSGDQTAAEYSGGRCCQGRERRGPLTSLRSVRSSTTGRGGKTRRMQHRNAALHGRRDAGPCPREELGTHRCRGPPKIAVTQPPAAASRLSGVLSQQGTRPAEYGPACPLQRHAAARKPLPPTNTSGHVGGWQRDNSQSHRPDTPARSLLGSAPKSPSQPNPQKSPSCSPDVRRPLPLPPLGFSGQLVPSNLSDTREPRTRHQVTPHEAQDRHDQPPRPATAGFPLLIPAEHLCSQRQQPRLLPQLPARVSPIPGTNAP